MRKWISIDSRSRFSLNLIDILNGWEIYQDEDYSHAIDLCSWSVFLVNITVKTSVERFGNSFLTIKLCLTQELLYKTIHRWMWSIFFTKCKQIEWTEKNLEAEPFVSMPVCWSSALPLIVSFIFHCSTIILHNHHRSRCYDKSFYLRLAVFLIGSRHSFLDNIRW